MIKHLAVNRIAATISLGAFFVFVWASAAYAALPYDDQYGDPTRRVGPVVGQGAEGAAGVTLGVLPLTGGPLFILVILVALALVGMGMLLFRYARRSQHS